MNLKSLNTMKLAKKKKIIFKELGGKLGGKSFELWHQEGSKKKITVRAEFTPVILCILFLIHVVKRAKAGPGSLSHHLSVEPAIEGEGPAPGIPPQVLTANSVQVIHTQAFP